MDALKATDVCRSYGRQKVLDGFGLTLDVAQDPGEKAWFDDIIVIAKENEK